MWVDVSFTGMLFFPVLSSIKLLSLAKLFKVQITILIYFIFCSILYDCKKCAWRLAEMYLNLNFKVVPT